MLLAVENDSAAAGSYRRNHPRVRLEVKDLRRLSPVRLKRELGLGAGDLTLLKACPPCQGFSTLGKGDLDDERNDLVTRVITWLKVFEPCAFVVENVPGLRTDYRLARLTRVARRRGYGVAQYVVDATAFGVPQRRRRLIVVGVAGLDDGGFPPNLEDLLPASFGSPWRTAGEVLDYAALNKSAIDTLNRSRQHSAAVVARIRAVPPGGSRADLPSRLRLECHKNLAKSAATSVYGRIREGEPAPTMTTRCTTPACGRFVHPHEDRGLTLREAALIQTFPAWYQFAGSYDEIERQIGNAVPVKMAEGVGLAVRRLISAAT